MCLKISQISQENTCVGISFYKSCSLRRLCNFIKKTPTQVFSCWICKTFKNIYYVEHLQIAVSGSCKHSIWTCFKIKDIDSTEFFRKIELPYPLSPPPLPPPRVPMPPHLKKSLLKGWKYPLRIVLEAFKNFQEYINSKWNP